MTSSRLGDPRIRKDKSPLYLQARRQILAMIGAGRFRPGSQLPPEDVLAETLGVSRPTVREALALLQIDGIVTRRHGAGNFVNHLPFNISARLDELISIPEVIAANAFQPSMTGLRITEVEASDQVAESLKLEPSSAVYLVQRLYLASGRPAVWVTDFIPTGLVPRRDLWVEFTGDMLQFFRKQLRRPMEYAVAAIDVVDADPACARHLRVRPGTGVLRIQQTAFTAGNVPVTYSLGYHRPGVVTYRAIRKVR
ncbi:MAG: GntR family transcriptional regulator [Armatimonadota bacterium]|nr:GntR family transcriptional regulator [Armatimonadota bacterium]MDR7475783.1 GntR family transcriptional regulator [Armatimonadota bacterium]MDR7538329.1 GntR family transcriptional regulator [Armatimonadota bacterium]